MREVLPLAFGVAVYGLAFGLLAAQAKMTGLQTGIMGTLVFAGSSQMIAVERLIAGAGAGTAILAGLALNLRLMLVTASLRGTLSARPWWQTMLGLHLSTDENWALLHARRAAGRDAGYWYLAGAGLMLAMAWVISTVAGATLAAALPQPRAIGVDFAFAAAFICILRALWTGRSSLLPWTASAGITAAAVLLTPLDPTIALILGGTGGAAAAGLAGHG
jgi:4-azaleucine resistance transporter AzlC